MTTPTITLADSEGTIALHKDLYWQDEFVWQEVEQTATRTITGAMIIQNGVKTAGRPITLVSEDGKSAAMSREVIVALRNWAAVPGKQLTLSIRGQSHNVIFRLQDAPAIDVAPWVHYDSVDDDDFYIGTLKFITV